MRPDVAGFLFHAAPRGPALGSLAVLFRGEEVGPADRRKLLDRVRAGEAIEIEFQARTFLQAEGEANRNHLRFKPGILRSLAKSFVGTPFLRDHDQRALLARGGTVIASKAVKLEGDAENDDEPGPWAFDQTIRAIKPWAVEGVLDGTIDRFSIGWHPTGPVLCSVHETEVFDGCFCYPGDVVEGETVEFLFTAAEGVEVSTVNVPAVPGTEIQGIRAALSAALGTGGASSPPRRAMDKRIAARLGLAEAASADDALAALERVLAEHKSLGAQLSVYEERAKRAEAALAEADRARQAEEARGVALRVETEISRLYQTGRLLRRDGQPDPMEAKLRGLVDSPLGYAAFEAQCSALVQVAPIGNEAQSDPRRAPETRRSPLPEGTPAELDALLHHPDVQRRLKATGVTLEDVAKFKGLGQLAELAQGGR